LNGRHSNNAITGFRYRDRGAALKELLLVILEPPVGFLHFAAGNPQAKDPSKK